ncbi:dephospho-CoA kinase [Salibacterium halotolerans]|uniref:Dephospho-CoA kinase n=1 Tax=Salibacterium halotolerans TaxID=1884432 RepID=A0A1I5VF63_9BACI|nr:dephospho-CoA kinase [Salibacterium halotolerans]SFQ06194.1 dephospho-CoA kinase [Salibacterium halotolerans]
MIIGLTGGIASGKSFISDALHQHGFPVIDADQTAREVVEPGEKAYEQILEQFGIEILEVDGTLNRKKLADRIFADDNQRRMLNQIMHPAIRQRILQKKADLQKKGKEVIVLDLPLLIENNLHFMVDKVMLVYVNEAEQKQRLMERDQAGEEDAKRRMASQLSMSDKRAHADVVIDNNGTQEASLAQLEHILKEWNIHPSSL